jgi:site-specific DNA-cytosine methylase
LDTDGKKVKRDFCHRAMDVYKPAGCITTAFDNPTSGAFLIYDGMANRGHPGYPGSQPQFRKMSHPEQAMRLMTIDITYPFHGTNKESITQIGNAIPPEFARHLLVHVTTKVVA